MSISPKGQIRAFCKIGVGGKYILPRQIPIKNYEKDFNRSNINVDPQNCYVNLHNPKMSNFISILSTPDHLQIDRYYFC